MKLFRHIAVIGALTAIVSTGIFLLVNSGLRRQKNDAFGKLNEMILKDTPYDIVFIGSSRTNLNVDPGVIDSVTHKKSFNFGLDGANIIDYNMHINAYLRAHKRPELIVLNIDPAMLDVNNKIKVPARYLPYCDHREIYDTLIAYSSWPMVARYMPFVGMSFYSDGTVNQALQAYIAPNTVSLNDPCLE